MFQRESRHPHKVQLLALARRFPISPLYFALPSASQPETASVPAVVDPSLSLILAANVVQIQATLAPSRIPCTSLGCKSTRIRRDCGRYSPVRHIAWKQVDVNRLPHLLRRRVAIIHCSATHSASFNDRVGTSFQHARRATLTNSAPNLPPLFKPQFLLKCPRLLHSFLKRRTRQPSVCFAHVLDFHRTMGDRAFYAASFYTKSLASFCPTHPTLVSAVSTLLEPLRNYKGLLSLNKILEIPGFWH